MIALEFPLFRLRVITRNRRQYVFDRVRRRYVALTPEEWVRQLLLHYFIEVMQYPSTLIAVEKSLPQIHRRADIVVYTPSLEPWMIVECKAPEVPLSESVLMQLVGYNFLLKANYLVISNGHSTWGYNCQTVPPSLLTQLPAWPSKPNG
ncbi:MAG: type I restriction enzyme HsdR N-terminal domain-containing protein [Thermoflavifilum sp.]|nr:type I restriction enzyme HsdR N-terminal domain-containing protein [Thermoflavifilum sp.]